MRLSEATSIQEDTVSHHQTDDGVNTGSAPTQDELIHRVHGFPIPVKAEPIPTVDDLVPLWTRESGKRGALSNAEKAAQAANATQRVAVQAMLDRLTSTEARVTDLTTANNGLRSDFEGAKRANEELTLSNEYLTDELERVRTRNRRLVRVELNLPRTGIVIGQLAAETGLRVTSIEVDSGERPTVSYLLGNAPVQYTTENHEVLINPGTTEEMTFRPTEHGLSEAQIAAAKAYFAANDKPNEDSPENLTLRLVACNDPACQRCVMLKHDLGKVRTEGEYAALVSKYADDGVHAEAQGFLGQMFGGATAAGPGSRDPWL